MGVIRVGNDALQKLAAEHVAVSAEVARSNPAPPVGPPAQLTSAAVAGGYETLAAASGVLAARLRATGSELSSAGERFAAQEGSSAVRLGAVSSFSEA